MSRTVGINPAYLSKLEPEQRTWLTGKAEGLKFFDEFLSKHGKHIFFIGRTNSGKTQKGYWLVNWLKHTEVQIWISSGKPDEILPLLCMGKKVRIITPEKCDIIIEERVRGQGWQRIADHPEVVGVNSPEGIIGAIVGKSYDKNRNYHPECINIIELRNSFHNPLKAVEWVGGFFETLARKTRLRQLPANLFPCTIHLDESHWALAGKRVSCDPIRTKTSEIITENALESRSAGIRLAMYDQDHNNITPASRENLLCAVLCHGADVKSDENPALGRWCQLQQPAHPSRFKSHQGRFVYEDGSSFPPDGVWNFPFFPRSEIDREWIKRVRVRPVGFYDIGSDEEKEEFAIPFPFMGIVPAFTMQEEKSENDEHYSRYHIPEEC